MDNYMEYREILGQKKILYDNIMMDTYYILVQTYGMYNIKNES